MILTLPRPAPYRIHIATGTSTCLFPAQATRRDGEPDYGNGGYAEQAIVPRLITIAAGERPADLTHDEHVAYDMAAALNRGASLPETTYQAALTTFGEQGLAEIVFLVCCFSMVGITLNAFDASVPGRDEHLD